MTAVDYRVGHVMDQLAAFATAYHLALHGWFTEHYEKIEGQS